MPEYDQKVVKTAGLSDRDLFLASHDAPPVYTEDYARLILALEGDEVASAAVNAVSDERRSHGDNGGEGPATAGASPPQT
jgi:hypothetical protein